MNKLVTIMKDNAVVSSLDVANNFHKRHDNVLQSIGGLLKNEETKKMFHRSTYTEQQNKEDYPMASGKHYKDIYKDCKNRLEWWQDCTFRLAAPEGR